MDGLECSEVALSETVLNKDLRIDSTFYTAKIIRNKNIKYVSIGECIINAQYGVSIGMNEDGEGYPIYRMNEMHNMLCDLSVEKYANLTREQFLKYKLNNGDVLFNRTNSYEHVGRTGVYYENGNGMTFASYLVRFVPDKSILLPEYLAAFLNSKYGIIDIKRRCRQSINQTNVNPEEVKEIQIPLLEYSIQEKIHELFVLAHNKRKDANNIYLQAEYLLMSKLVLQDFAISTESISIKTLSASFLTSGRFDAEYYQPKYDDYETLLKTTDTVLSICNLYDKNFTPFKDTKYKYIELGNVGSYGNISNVETVIGKDLPSRARRKVKAGQIIVASVEGSLQSCALVTNEYNNALCSTGFYVLDSDSINSETLLVLFKSEPIQALLKRRCSGTILTAITKNELLNMPLAKIDQEVQKQIAEKIQESFGLRYQSEQLLENAKRAVEIAIEEGEDKAIDWLNNLEL
ncbi:restriction endonuclease subunit S [Sedimentibacter sp. MB35-C1]|uniref:restriction endonuclease subunit S n=1 Tax=Sedimentibacter sp. MB35-C1 TaxID=3070995 RepID=UPI0027DF639D|nr:restriction endonuclease subunit S [Sedimentibacter sp. MB35-C1]WMJ77841.1 restriction endonuclease subunit S [Sedimentibacter sp. MB35-C1]